MILVFTTWTGLYYPLVSNSDSVFDSKDPTELRVLQYNIRGLVNKQDDLNKILVDNDIDVALLCKTWLNASNVNRINISGYDFVFKNRTNRKGEE